MTMTPRTIAALALVPALLTGCGAVAAESTAGSVRTVETTLGKVSVPADIDSVVVLEGRRDLDIVLSLGLPLTGYPYEEKGSLDLTSPTADALETAQQNGAKELFLADEINLEAIIGADPDLIVSRAEDVEPIRAELEAIAPVIAIGDQSTSTWQDDLELVAAATGTEDRAQTLIDEYSTRVSALKDQYGPALRENTFVPSATTAKASKSGPTDCSRSTCATSEPPHRRRSRTRSTAKRSPSAPSRPSKASPMRAPSSPSSTTSRCG